MQCHPTPGEHRGNTVVGEDRQPHSTCSHRDKDTHQAPQVRSLLSVQVQVCFSLPSAVPSPSYSNSPVKEGGFLTFITEDTGPNVL